jgi:hypothetical protein
MQFCHRPLCQFRIYPPNWGRILICRCHHFRFRFWISDSVFSGTKRQKIPLLPLLWNKIIKCKFKNESCLGFACWVCRNVAFTVADGLCLGGRGEMKIRIQNWESWYDFETGIWSGNSNLITKAESEHDKLTKAWLFVWGNHDHDGSHLKLEAVTG